MSATDFTKSVIEAQRELARLRAIEAKLEDRESLAKFIFEQTYDLSFEEAEDIEQAFHRQLADRIATRLKGE